MAASGASPDDEKKAEGYWLRLENVRDEMLDMLPFYNSPTMSQLAVLKVLYQFKHEEVVATTSCKNTDYMRKGCGFLSEAQTGMMSFVGSGPQERRGEEELHGLHNYSGALVAEAKPPQVAVRDVFLLI